jgi:hypothetical protein
MIELHLTKIPNGFIAVETNESYIFQTFMWGEDTELQYKIIGTTQGLFGTDKGIILLNTDCAIDDVTYPNIEEFITALYAV